MVNTLRLVIGAVVNLEMWTMLLLNMFVLACIIKSRLYAKKDNPVYLLAGFNILSEICQLVVHVSYVGPTIISGSWFFAGQESLGVTVVATIFLGIWYLGSLIQILFATNRFSVICFPTRTFFTRERVIVLIAISCLAASGMVTYSQILSPCCRITPDPRFFGYSYLVFPNRTDNPSMNHVDLPLDIGTSVYCLTSYISLFVYIIKKGARRDRTGKRELRCCIQFLLMFLTYTVTWLTFFLYPAIGIQAPEAYVATTLVFMLNCGINSIIYLALNKEVRCAANRLVGRKIFNEISSMQEKTIASSRAQKRSTVELPTLQK
ncbi:unnamed protein product [Heligmosomoides polygyrus]|uniref:G_PROTEIN_RECEP_F1_2 domain-containing protein n=1 Tax=Heligmosomoides polygyrus TaxID=6339 RepID=A0A3P8D296_HELPZ|nr:unnamed protein product [Heligmosomoides polygyrus]